MDGGIAVRTRILAKLEKLVIAELEFVDNKMTKYESMYMEKSEFEKILSQPHLSAGHWNLNPGTPENAAYILKEIYEYEIDVEVDGEIPESEEENVVY